MKLLAVLCFNAI